MIAIVSKPGRLGNDLFLFSHVIAFSLEHGLPVADPSFNDSADLFDWTRSDLFCRFPPKRSVLPSWRPLRAFVYRVAWALARAALRLSRARDRAAALFPDQEIRFVICSDTQQDEKVFAGPSIFGFWAGFYGGALYYELRDPTAWLTTDDFKSYWDVSCQT